MKTLFAKAAVMASALVWLGHAPSAGAAPHELAMTGMLMTTHPVIVKAFQPMCDLLKERTGGKLEITLYNPGTLVPDAELYQSMERGIVDMSMFFPPRTPHLFPIGVLADYPFLFDSSLNGSLALAALHENNQEMRREFSKVHMLEWPVSTPKDLVSLKPVRTLEDLSGKRVGVMDAASSEVMRLLGATPITLPAADMYMSLQRGMLDAVLAPIPMYKSTKVCEVGKYITKCNISCSAAVVGMNRKSYEALPADVRAEIDRVAGMPFTAMYSWWVDYCTGEDLQYLKDNNGVQVIPLAPEESARWKEKVRPMYDEWIAAARKAGVKDPEGILKQLQEYAEKYRDPAVRDAVFEACAEALGPLAVK